MAIFIDTGIFVAVRNAKETNHQRSISLMTEALKGKYGVMYTSDYIVDEAITVALARTHNHKIAVNTGRYVLDSPRIVKLAVTQELFQEAWRRFQDDASGDLSFTDCASLAVMGKQGIQQVMSFDSGFDKHTKRIK